MSANRPGYVGGYINPEMKERFVLESEKNGMNQTNFLNKVLREYFNGEFSQQRYLEDEGTEYLEDFWERWDEIGPLVRQELNCFILEAAGEVDEFSSIYIPEVLENLADTLREKAADPIPYVCEDAMDFQEVLPEVLSNEIITVIGKAVDEVIGTGVRKEDLFRTAAHFLDERADTLYVDARSFQLTFERKEWFYLDRLVTEVNREFKTEFSNLQELIIYILGEKMEHLGTGFFSPRDRGMLEMGKRFKQELN